MKENIKIFSMPFFDIENSIITKLDNGGIYLVNLKNRTFHFIGGKELELLKLFNGKRTIKEISCISEIKDENRICKFIVACFNNRILGEPPKRRFDPLMIVFPLLNPSKVFKPKSNIVKIIANLVLILSFISIITSFKLIITNSDEILNFFFDVAFFNVTNI